MLGKVVLFHYNSAVNSWLRKKIEKGSIKMKATEQWWFNLFAV